MNRLGIFGLDYGEVLFEGAHLLPFFYWGLGLGRIAGFAHFIAGFNCLYH